MIMIGARRGALRISQLDAKDDVVIIFGTDLINELALDQ